MRARLLTALVLATLSSGRPVLAQADSCPRRALPVSIINKRGEAVHGLSANNFQAMVKGKAVKVLSVTANDPHVRTMILLDRSSSMLQGELVWNGYLEAAKALASRMPHGSVTGVTAFADEILGSVPFTSDAEGLRDALSGLSSVPKSLKQRGGATALWDALVSAASFFENPRPGDTIYALTDGGDNSSRIRHERAQKILESKGIRLFAFSIPAGGERGTRGEARDLEQLARATGGNVVTVTRKYKELAALLTDGSGKPTEEAGWLASQFHQIYDFYQIEIELPEIGKKPSKWSLVVVGPNQPDLVLSYPQELAACNEMAADSKTK
ncbi:MAG: vWA domain-containing protein [Candidatus Acidiferrales bacterium]